MLKKPTAQSSRWSYEERARDLHGARSIAGVDEAGRGPIAGPVIAGACILPSSFDTSLIDDSKKLSEKRRELAFEALTNDPTVKYGVGIVSPHTIDEVNILQASILAMHRALEQVEVDFVLVDGPHFHHPKLSFETIKKGDSLSYSIGAASIIAKVLRDRLMKEWDVYWPAYGFGKHKGYPTKYHLAAVEIEGLCPLHRLSFKWKKEPCLS